MIAENLKQLIHEKYEGAVANGDLQLTESSVKKAKDKKSGVQYLVTCAPSLSEKPKGADQSGGDPFADPAPELVVSKDLNGDGEYQLLLNKFPVVPEHVLLATNEFKDQDSALTPAELLMAYKYICTLDDEDEDVRNLVFYNCGPLSGSSQRHKHLQSFVLPANFTPFQDNLCNGKEHFLPNLQNEPLQDEKVSFAHFVLPLPEQEQDVDEDLLAMCYISLLQRTLTFFQDWLNEKPDLVKSYNVLLTKRWICLVPRSKEASTTKEDGVALSINATGYAGMILAKDNETFQKLVTDPELMDKALFECGFPSTAGQKPSEYHY
ncbi:bifunctional AP-4-A phosphorylase/ADP sulfurylase KNAG_0F00110 [Huiozyma naganishii CBS 8797]|uniref:Uncharacterized protein n=1 Tax=Huiozyma naganishii (strain ATCC MYA-139 / BCRC 22969 / CBS 8797 / KCTC 17520 / NBRC 10181 / NCYC 3082 / Yp74L-3) TaxID=1071383 RepID=J7RMB2_HUIN7|nr:hypothetical protein KNAG_0F00110 [Kazachstania naganishii CBS 8797]CCK70683.1 hypothetical protein KNAG_0F00110 [Kazachstania naganishii CBS 8797]